MDNKKTMNKVKSFLKKWPPVYRLLQNFYYSFRKIIETYILGTKFQEWIWERRGLNWAKGYVEEIPHLHRQLLINKISVYAPFNSILEIGCASGPNLRLIAKRFPKTKITGIEINEKAVKVGNELFLKEGISNAKLLVGKADKLGQFPDKSFDIVFTDAVLICIGPDKIEKVASEMQRIAKKAIILVEHHSEEESAFGIYNKGNWLRDYKKLFQSFSSQIKATKISPEIWGGDWGELGYIIEVIL